VLKGCWGKFGEAGECIECEFMELCSSYFVVERNKGCPLFGEGFEKANEICRLCLEYFVGEECKRKSSERSKQYNKNR
jgi:hypothetical protein